MIGIAHWIERGDGPQALAGLARIEAGEAMAEVAGSLAIGPPELVGAIARAGLGPEGSEGPPLVRGPSPRPGLARRVAEAALADIFPKASRPDRLALAAGLLQILDAWDASHEAAQEADDLGEAATSAYWHLIAHRREPDPGNARYWARRVGPRHPAFGPIRAAAAAAIEAAGHPPAASRLIAGPGWSPDAFIEFTTRARPGSPDAALARRLQRVEMVALLDQTLLALGPPAEG